MSAPTMNPTTSPASTRRVPISPVSLGSVFRSEWVKLSTLRSTWLALGAAVFGMIFIGGAVGFADNAQWSHMHPGELAHFNAIDESLTGVNIAQLIIAVLGVLIISGEYATGMIRSSLAAVPRRMPVLTAKLGVFFAMAVISMTVATFAAFFIGQATLSSHGTTIGATNALRAVLGTIFYLVVVALLSVAIGFIVRSTAGGIASAVGLLLVLPAIGGVLPQSWQDHVIAYLPSNAGAALYSAHADSSAPLSLTTASITLILWVVAAVVIAAQVLTRRDA